MTGKREAHRQALRQLLDRHDVLKANASDAWTTNWRRESAKEQLIDEILRVNDRFNSNPSLDEALNSGDGSYKS